MGDLEGVEHCVEDNSYFQEKVVLYRSDVDDIFLHEEGFLVGLEKDVKIGSEQFDIDFLVVDALLVFGILILAFSPLIWDFGDRDDHQPLFEFFYNFVQILFVLLLVRVDNVGHVEIVEQLLVFVL
jgi:hypothetical protein